MKKAVIAFVLCAVCVLSIHAEEQAVKPPRPPNDDGTPAKIETPEEVKKRDRMERVALSEKSGAERAQKKKVAEYATKEAQAWAEVQKELGGQSIDDWFKTAYESGAIKKYKDTSYWVNPVTWALMNRDQKENCIRSCAAYSKLHSPFGAIATVKSFSDDSTLGETTWTGGVSISK